MANKEYINTELVQIIEKDIQLARSQENYADLDYCISQKVYYLVIDPCNKIFGNIIPFQVKDIYNSLDEKSVDITDFEMSSTKIYEVLNQTPNGEKILKLCISQNESFRSLLAPLENHDKKAFEEKADSLDMSVLSRLSSIAESILLCQNMGKNLMGMSYESIHNFTEDFFDKFGIEIDRVDYISVILKHLLLYFIKPTFNAMDDLYTDYFNLWLHIRGPLPLPIQNKLDRIFLNEDDDCRKLYRLNISLLKEDYPEFINS